MKYHYEKLINNVTIRDIGELAKHSIFNHHVNGMHYLCLNRTNDLTLKIYYCSDVGNPNSGYLVHPHNHRYEFDSTVLKGELQHLRFQESKNHGELVTKYGYDWQTKQLKEINNVCLYTHRDDNCKEGYGYTVLPNEIHTLKLLSPVVIIGLIQYEDKIDNAVVYKKPTVEFEISKAYTPTTQEYLDKLMEIKRHLTNE